MCVIVETFLEGYYCPSMIGVLVDQKVCEDMQKREREKEREKKRARKRHREKEKRERGKREKKVLF